MANSLFYNELEYTNNIEEPKCIETLRAYSERNALLIFLIRFPVVDIRHVTYNEHFMLLIPGCKITFIQESDDNFDEYCDDVDEAILYLYQKYDSRPVLGRYRPLADKITARAKISDLENIDAFISSIRLSDPKERRRSELLISYCIGSINKVEDVGDDVPKTLLDKVKHKILLFDGAQTRFIYSKLNKDVVKIQGLSGTGKTELLLHKLKELYIKENDCKIFFTCHNKILANTLRKRIIDFFDYMKVNQQLEWNERLWCANAWGRQSDSDSGLYVYICSYYGIPYERYTYSSSFENICKNALSALSNLPKFEPCFDYVIVDECQDFGENFTEMCKKVARCGVYMAGDIFQSIFVEPGENTYDADYLLSKCYRTAPNTLMFAHALGLGLFEEKRYGWLNEEDWRACGYKVEYVDDSISLSREPAKRFDGDNEEYESIIFKITNHHELSQTICGIITDLQKENNNKLTPNDIAIIFIDDDDDIYFLANKVGITLEEKLGWNVNKAYENKKKLEDRVLISNKNNVKGLEFPYVICVTDGIRDEVFYRNLIYTMLTRSFIKSFLVVTGSNVAIKKEILDGWKCISENHKITVRVPDNDQIQKIRMQSQKAKAAMSVEELIEQYVRKQKWSKEFNDTLWSLLKLKGVYELEDEEEVKSMIVEVINYMKKG